MLINEIKKSILVKYLLVQFILLGLIILGTIFSIWEYGFSTITIILIASTLMSLIASSISFKGSKKQNKVIESIQTIEKEHHSLSLRFGYLIKYSNDIIWLLDEKANFVDVNDRALSIYGYTREEFFDMNASKICTEEKREEFWKDLKTTSLQDGFVNQTIHTKKDGSVFPVEVSSRKIGINGKVFYQSVVRDISERISFQKKILIQNRIYAVLSNVNQAISRIRVKHSLLQEICRIVVEDGQLSMAMIAFVNEEKRIIEPYSGVGEIYNLLIDETIELDLNYNELTPSAKAVIDNHVFICNDIRELKIADKWKLIITRMNIKSLTCFPLVMDEKVIGVLSIYSQLENFFNEPEIKLFEELASDIVYAIKFINKEEDFQKLIEELRISEARYKMLFESNPYPMWLFDAATLKFIEVNMAAIKHYGYSREEFLSMTIKDIRPQEDVDGLLKDIAMDTKGIDVSGVWRHIKKSGELIYVEVTSHDFSFEDRKCKLVLSYDVTERITAERKERYIRKEHDEILKRLRLQIEQMPMALIVTDVNFKILEWNPAAENIFGFSKMETMGKHTFKLLTGNDTSQEIKSIIEKITSGNESVIFTMKNIHKEGSRIICEWYGISLRNDKNQYIGIMAMVRDITDAKSAEDEIRKSRESFRELAAHLQKSREDERLLIAREIHDEIGQVLTSIKMNLSLLNRDLESTETVNRKEIINEIKSMSFIIDKSVIRLRKLITELRPEILDKLGLIPALEWKIQGFESQSDIKCTFNTNIESEILNKDFSIVVFRIMQEALTNVARHAKASKVDVKIIMTDQELVLNISDNGIGMDVNKLKEIKSFGLLGMQERAFLIGGKLEILSEPGNGTQIVLTANVK